MKRQLTQPTAVNKICGCNAIKYIIIQRAIRCDLFKLKHINTSFRGYQRHALAHIRQSMLSYYLNPIL